MKEECRQSLCGSGMKVWVSACNHLLDRQKCLILSLQPSLQDTQILISDIVIVILRQLHLCALLVKIAETLKYAYLVSESLFSR